MDQTEPASAVDYEIELVLRVSGRSGPGQGDLARLTNCADRLERLAENILEEEFGGSLVLVSPNVGLVSGRSPRKASRRVGGARGPSKKDLILKMLGRDGGATMKELQGATGWRQSTVPAQLTYLSKLGNRIKRETVEGVLRYRLER